MASRNPTTGDNWTKAEEEAFNKAEFKKNLARFESMTPKELGSTGPSHEGMGTEFSPDRWQAYIDWLKKAGMEAEAAQLANAVVEKVEMKVLPKELYWDEDATEAEIEADIQAYDEGGPYVKSNPDDALTIEWTDDSGKTRTVGQRRGLTGNRDPETGDFIQGPSDVSSKTFSRPIDIENFEKDDESVTTSDNQIPTDDIIDAINARKPELAARAKDREERLKNLESIVDIKDEDSVENWMDNFESMSDDMFESIKLEDLAQYGANAEDAYTEVKLAKDTAEDEYTDAQMDAAETDREAMEMGAELSAEMEAADNAELDALMKPAEDAADKLDADYEARTFPMMGMSDKDKGMFTYKKTESKDDKTIDAGIGVITQDTGMNEEQARQLMTKLKGICG
jgi:hypothetical protein